ncbi:hypothetical protein B0H14DRAFT_2739910 [Mycena olivaceomarginata]|nr:hypothetical protein B0H14DRAFT_2739910 [Mycena olivaceomarginata]
MPLCFVVLELGMCCLSSPEKVPVVGVFKPIVRPLHILIPALPIATYPPETRANLGYLMIHIAASLLLTVLAFEVEVEYVLSAEEMDGRRHFLWFPPATDTYALSTGATPPMSMYVFCCLCCVLRLLSESTVSKDL